MVGLFHSSPFIPTSPKCIQNPCHALLSIPFRFVIFEISSTLCFAAFMLWWCGVLVLLLICCCDSGFQENCGGASGRTGSSRRRRRRRRWSRGHARLESQIIQSRLRFEKIALYIQNTPKQTKQTSKSNPINFERFSILHHTETTTHPSTPPHPMHHSAPVGLTTCACGNFFFERILLSRGNNCSKTKNIKI